MEGFDFKVIMGDLFDEYNVPPEVVLRCADLLEKGCTPIYILCGNHDASKELEKKSSFDLLKRLLARNKQVHFVDGTEPLVYGEFAFIGWHPFISAAEMASKLPEKGLTTVFGHWDVIQHGKNDHNMIPLDILKSKGITQIYTGHYHKASYEKMRDGTELYVVGSMQPYAHGEQAEDDPLYMTLSIEDVNSRLKQDETCFKNSNVRILLKDGEQYADHFDCLSMLFKRQTTGVVADADDVLPEVGFDEFNFDHIALHCFNKNNVDEDMRTQILTSIEEKNFHD